MVLFGWGIFVGGVVSRFFFFLVLFPESFPASSSCFCFCFFFWFYFQTGFLLLVLGPFGMFQGCELPRAAILLVEFVSVFHFPEQRRAQVPGC